MKLRPKRIMKKPGSLLPMRKKTCRFCTDKLKVINYKEVKQLEFFVKERGGISSTRGSGNCARHQRRVCEEIKKGRFLALLPYVRM